MATHFIRLCSSPGQVRVARKGLLLMFVNVLLLAFTPLMVRRGSSSFKRVGETVTVRLNERLT
jgi:hypothetical protein